MSKIEIKTRDGLCPTHVYRPAGVGPSPAVLVFMDGLGIRPAMLQLGERLATHGYFVLLPDLFYRAGPYEPMDPKSVFSDPQKRKILMEKYFAVATSANIMSDTSALLDFVAAQPDVKPGGIGVTDYCMGGRLSLIAAGTYPAIGPRPARRGHRSCWSSPWTIAARSRRWLRSWMPGSRRWRPSRRWDSKPSTVWPAAIRVTASCWTAASAARSWSVRPIVLTGSGGPSSRAAPGRWSSTVCRMLAPPCAPGR